MSLKISHINNGGGVGKSLLACMRFEYLKKEDGVVLDADQRNAAGLNPAPDEDTIDLKQK